MKNAMGTPDGYPYPSRWVPLPIVYLTMIGTFSSHSKRCNRFKRKNNRGFSLTSLCSHQNPQSTSQNSRWVPLPMHGYPYPSRPMGTPTHRTKSHQNMTKGGELGTNDQGESWWSQCELNVLLWHQREKMKNEEVIHWIVQYRWVGPHLWSIWAKWI